MVVACGDTTMEVATLARTTPCAPMLLPVNSIHDFSRQSWNNRGLSRSPVARSWRNADRHRSAILCATTERDRYQARPDTRPRSSQCAWRPTQSKAKGYLCNVNAHMPDVNAYRPSRARPPTRGRQGRRSSSGATRQHEQARNHGRAAERDYGVERIPTLRAPRGRRNRSSGLSRARAAAVPGARPIPPRPPTPPRASTARQR